MSFSLILKASAAMCALSLINVSPSHAAAPGGFDAMSLLPIALIFAVFYFMLLRPQQKKMKTHQELLSKLKRGDTVVTSGGIIGVIQKTTDTEAQLEIDRGVRVTVIKSMITEVRSGSSSANEVPEKLGERTAKSKSSKKSYDGEMPRVASAKELEAQTKALPKEEPTHEPLDVTPLAQPNTLDESAK